MKEGLHTENIWEMITQEIQSNNSKSYVAVPYFGRNAFKKLPLKKGSILLVNCSKSVVESGATSPFEIIKMIKEGVSVYSYSNLHSKLYVTKSALIVGSANATDNSEKLHEVVWYSMLKEEIIKSREYIKSFINPNKQLSIEELENLVPYFNTKPRQEINNGFHSPKVSILQFESFYPPEEFYDTNKIIKERNQKELLTYSEFKIDNLCWSSKISNGQIIIQAYKEKGKIKYYPPSVVIDTEPYIYENKVYYNVLIKSPKRKKSIDQNNLKELIPKEDIKYFKRNTILPIRISKILLVYWDFYGKKI